ncbi:MAG: aldehyde reductase [Desulfobacterales bacterium]|jgi:dihydroflavonol-4-reductase
MNENSETTVLVTGATGFIAKHCILKLLEQNYKVRGTIRSMGSETGLRATFAKHISADDRLEFVPADLTSDVGWNESAIGCQYVIHTASPVPSEPPKDESEVIVPARDGTLRVLNAAVSAKVKRVVVTSSLAAISYGHDDYSTKVFNEDDWSNTDRPIAAYAKSKTLAERASWDFIDSLDDSPIELSTINPGYVLGPILDKNFSASGEIIRKLMRRDLPGCPDLDFPLVDVRDVADAHIAAMTKPQAAGMRFCCVAGNGTMQEIAIILNKHFAEKGYKARTWKMPNIMVRLAAVFDKTVRLVVNDLGRRSKISNDRIKEVLDWKAHSVEEMVIAMAESMIEHRVV